MSSTCYYQDKTVIPSFQSLLNLFALCKVKCNERSLIKYLFANFFFAGLAFSDREILCFNRRVISCISSLHKVHLLRAALRQVANAQLFAAPLGRKSYE